MDLNGLIKRCVDCCEDSIRDGECGKCGRRYEFRDGVLDAWPQRKEDFTPKFYKTRLFRTWTKVWQEMISDWVIYSSSFKRYFAMSGHRQTAKFIQKYRGAGGVVVDLGCANGTMVPLIQDSTYIGLDSNLVFLKKMKQKFPAAIAIHADLANMPFSTGELKSVASLHTLEHVYRLAEALEEIHRILSEEGLFFFSIPTEGGWGWKWGRRLVTGPFLKKKFNLDVEPIVAVEHINDARRVLKFIGFYFRTIQKAYLPFRIPSLNLNQSVAGVAKKIRMEEACE